MAEKSSKIDSPMIIIGEVGRTEIGALFCDVLLVAMFFYNQIAYSMNMWFIILPLSLIGIYLMLFGVLPEKYHFTETALEIHNLFYKVASIPYGEVFNFESTSRDNFVNLLMENKVKVYHTVGKTKKLTVCKPRDVHAFAEQLKKRCPEFCENGQKSKLEIFLEK